METISDIQELNTFTTAINSPHSAAEGSKFVIPFISKDGFYRNPFTSFKRLATASRGGSKVLRWATIPPSQKGTRPLLQLRVPTTHQERAVSEESHVDGIPFMHCNLARLRPPNLQSQQLVQQHNLPFSRENLGCNTIYKAPTSPIQSHAFPRTKWGTNSRASR